MSHKRGLSDGEASAAKRQSQAAPRPEQPTNPPETAKQYVYLALEVVYGAYRQPFQEVFEIYATVEDANQRLLNRLDEAVNDFELEGLDEDELDPSYDKYGCLCADAQNEEDDRMGHLFEVRRLLVRPPGSVPDTRVPRKRDSDGSAEEDVENDEELSEIYEEPTSADEGFGTTTKDRQSRNEER